jgi:hypothetical protein
MSDPDTQYAPPPVRGAGPFGLSVRRAAPGPCDTKIAGVLRENLSGKNSNRLTMTWRVTSGIGVEHFSSGDHAGEKRRASCGALRHPPVCCPDCLFETIDPPGRPIPGSKPESDLEFTSRPFRGRNKAEGVHRSWSPGWSGSPASGRTSGAPLITQARSRYQLGSDDPEVPIRPPGLGIVRDQLPAALAPSPQARSATRTR